MGGCLVHPSQKVVIPLAPEAIVYQDGVARNDCEKSALKRFLANVKKDHPYLKLIIMLDGLYADGPTIRLIKSYGWHYIIVAKDGNHNTDLKPSNILVDYTRAEAPDPQEAGSGITIKIKINKVVVSDFGTAVASRLTPKNFRENSDEYYAALDTLILDTNSIDWGKMISTLWAPSLFFAEQGLAPSIGMKRALCGIVRRICVMAPKNAGRALTLPVKF